MAGDLFDFAVITIFAREVLEGSIIIGEYRTIILRGDALEPGIARDDALRETTLSAVFASALAVLVIAAVAIPLAILSNDFDTTTSNIIEGLSKIVAAICILQLSLKIPKWLGVYPSLKKGKASESRGLTLNSIRFNVAWNIWREVAECGVFLLPFFLHGEGIVAIPLSAVVGTVAGLVLGLGLYVANKRLEDKNGLALFAVLLLVFLSAGLFTGGCHKMEMELGSTTQVWKLHGSFWSVNRLPMTALKPFGYNDSRTVLEIACYWSALTLAALLHYRKYRLASSVEEEETEEENNNSDFRQQSSMSSRQDEHDGTVDLEISLGDEPLRTVRS